MCNTNKRIIFYDQHITCFLISSRQLRAFALLSKSTPARNWGIRYLSLSLTFPTSLSSFLVQRTPKISRRESLNMI